MRRIDLKCGFLCNNRCRFCVQGDKRTQYGDISTSQLLQRLTEGRQYADQLVLTGGEVTIKKDFLNLVREAKTLGYAHIQIQTNGRMFSDPGFCEAAIAAGAGDFSLALHGHLPELHDYLTRSPGSFYQTVKGIKNLKKFGKWVGTNSVINRSNYRHLPDLARLLVYLQVDQFQLAFIHGTGSVTAAFRQLVPRYQAIEPYVKRALDLGLKAGKTVMTEAIPYCFMEGYHACIAEKIIPQTRIFDIRVIDDYTDYRRNQGKSKGLPCGRCRHTQICEGPWKEYPENYGWSEFIPCTASESVS